MGQKVHPKGFRLIITKDWDSKWYAEGKDYQKFLHEDLKLSEMLKKNWYNAGISRIEIERIAKVIRFTIHTARPGMVIGKGGKEIQRIRQILKDMTGKNVFINVQEIPNPDIDAQIVAENVAAAIERRVSYRRAMKQAIFRAMKAGAKGIKVQCSGRLGGAEIARREWYLEGRLPLSTLRANIDYGFCEAKTIYGVIGVKVWIYKGDFEEEKKEETEKVEVTQ